MCFSQQSRFARLSLKLHFQIKNVRRISAAQTQSLMQEYRDYSHSTKTKQFRLCIFAFCLSHYFDFTIYLYYPVLKRPCYHFVIEVDNKNNFTVDNIEVVCKYYKRFCLEFQEGC